MPLRFYRYFRGFMNLVDLLIWVILIAFAVKGFLKGLIREILSLAGVVIAGWLAFRLFPSVSASLTGFVRLPSQVAAVISFVLIFAFVSALFFCIGVLATALCKMIFLGGVNRVGGALFALLQGAFVLALALHFLARAPFAAGLRPTLQSSGTARSLSACGSGIAEGWSVAHPKPGWQGKGR